MRPSTGPAASFRPAEEAVEKGSPAKFTQLVTSPRPEAVEKGSTRCRTEEVAPPDAAGACRSTQRGSSCPGRPRRAWGRTPEVTTMTRGDGVKCALTSPPIAGISKGTFYRAVPGPRGNILNRRLAERSSLMASGSPNVGWTEPIHGSVRASGAYGDVGLGMRGVTVSGVVSEPAQS